jgi:hypothetical protein
MTLDVGTGIKINLKINHLLLLQIFINFLQDHWEYQIVSL